MMNFLTRAPSWIVSHWRTGAAVSGAVGIAVACSRCLETDKTRAERVQLLKEKEVRALADRISSYGRKVHRHYPTGDVVVGENESTKLVLTAKDMKEIDSALAGYKVHGGRMNEEQMKVVEQ